MQKKNREGFTLIELLAVIVILAIIALIAVPVIMNVITKARVSAFEDSAYGIVKAGEMYYTNKLLDTEGMTKNEEFTVVGDVFKNTENSDTLDLSGSMPSSGKVKVTTEGKVAIAISNGEYCIRKATTESKVKAEKLSDLGGKCEYKEETGKPNTVFTAATGETSIPACITNNTECSVGTKVGVQVNASDKKDFYVISDNTSENEITLLMSENLGETVAWASKTDYLAAGGTEEEWGDGTTVPSGNTNKGPITALAYLKTQTSGWTNIPETTYQIEDENNMYQGIKHENAKARLLTYTEASTLLSLSDNSWVYGNLNDSSAPYGYWTSSAYAGSSGSAWSIYFGGGTSDGIVHFASSYGVRPVITISKSVP